MALIALLAAAPPSAAQGELNESDFDTSVPPADDAYLYEDAGAPRAPRATPMAVLVAVAGLAATALLLRRE